MEIGFVPIDSIPTSAELNKHSENVNLLKAVIAGGLWPRVARVHLPKSAVKFDKVQAGAVQRENTANEFKFFDIGTGRVFLHPASILFSNAVWKSPFVAYFQKHSTTKVFLRDATEVNDVPSFTPKLTRVPDTTLCSSTVWRPVGCEPRRGGSYHWQQRKCR